MKEIKVSKSISITLDNATAIEEMMRKTRRNFSWTLNYILTDWIKLRTQLAEKRMTRDLDQRIQDIKNAKVIRE